MSAEKPKVAGSLAEKELDKAEAQFNAQEEQIKSLTLDRMKETAKPANSDPNSQLVMKDSMKNDTYLKPRRSIGSREKFNEKFRDEYNFLSEYVNFEARNNEIIGEAIEFWTKPFPGMPAQEWVVPCNKAVWAPRFVAEKIKKSSYHRLIMEESGPVVGQDPRLGAQYQGQMIADSVIQRLDALPVSNRKSIFMGANSFA
jgi:hypothetical protein